MTRRKKRLRILLAAVLLAVVLWYYWERPMTLASLLPESAWSQAEVLITDFDRGTRESACGTFPAQTILALLEETKVDRRQRDPYLNDSYFQIRLYREDGFPVFLYVQSDGHISLATDLREDGYRYYEHGQRLFEALQDMSEEK